MPADLTPERRVELRAAVDAAKEEADENEYFGRAEGYRHSADDAMRASFTLQTLFALLDAADRADALEKRVAELEAAAELVMGGWMNVKTRDNLRAVLLEEHHAR